MGAQNECYAKARTLATIEHHGETFRICKRRINGKPWRGYLCLVHGGTYVAALKDGITDIEQARALFVEQLGKCFATRESLLKTLAPILEKYNPAGTSKGQN